MKSVSAVDQKVCDNLLTDAGARNLAVDLVVVRGENLQAILHSRFLRVELAHRDGSSIEPAVERVLLEVPTHNSHPVILQPGQFVEVYFKVDHERFGFDSRVVGYGRVQIDDNSIVDAVDLAPPHVLEHRQRRKLYRVSVASLPAVPARMWPADADPEQVAPIEARLCNLSAGGVAVLVDRQRWQFTSDHYYRLQFALPGDNLKFQFEFQTVVCHVRHVFHSRRQIVGLAFLPRPDMKDHRQAIEKIAQFVSAQQREDLFRSRMGLETEIG